MTATGAPDKDERAGDRPEEPRRDGTAWPPWIAPAAVIISVLCAIFTAWYGTSIQARNDQLDRSLESILRELNDIKGRMDRHRERIQFLERER